MDGAKSFYFLEIKNKKLTEAAMSKKTSNPLESASLSCFNRKWNARKK